LTGFEIPVWATARQDVTPFTSVCQYVTDVPEISAGDFTISQGRAQYTHLLLYYLRLVFCRQNGYSVLVNSISIFNDEELPDVA